MKTTISEHLANLRLGAIANIFCCFRPSHLCCFILSVALVACSTTPGILVDAQSEMFSPVISEDHNPKTVAIFLNWYSGCPLGECDTPRAALRDRAAACIQSGLRRVHPDLRAIPGPVQLRQDTSALVADPREHGQPDSRFGTDLVAKLGNEEIYYAVVLDISRVLGTAVRATDLEAVAADKVAGLLLSRRARTPVDGRAEAILIELNSRRWLARMRRDFKDTETYSAGVVLIGYLPFPVVPRASSSSAATSACVEVGEALGYVLVGQQGPRPFREKERLRRAAVQDFSMNAAARCAAEQFHALEDLCH